MITKFIIVHKSIGKRKRKKCTNMQEGLIDEIEEFSRNIIDTPGS